MFSKIFNIGIRVVMILLGAAMIIAGLFFSDRLNDSTLITVMGVIVMLFGIYRLSMYWIHADRYQFDNDEEDEDEKDEKDEK